MVDLCAAGEVNESSKVRSKLNGDETHGIHCSAHYVEYIGSIFVAVSMTAIFLATQQKVVVLVDKGVLKGIGARMSRLP